MNSLKDILEITRKLKEHLMNGTDNEGREQFIEQIEVLLNERELYFSAIPMEFTEEDRRLNEEILRLNTEIVPILACYLNEIKMDIKKLNQSKKTVRGYNNPYESGPEDGMFLDKRK